MEMELTLPAAFLVGMLGGVHCAGMCGGIVGALAGGLDAELRQSRWRMLSALLAYNTGRITSYTIAGLAAGLVGQQFSTMNLVGDFPAGRVLAGVFMILFGFYLGGWWNALRIFEKAGSHVWRRIEPLGRRLVPVRGVGQAWLLGLLWGWLPCGMVYAVLAMALASSSVLYGGLVMLAFGLGTLPLMVAMGFAFGKLVTVLQGRIIRGLAGVTVILFGIYTLLPKDMSHGHHGMPGHGQHDMHEQHGKPAQHDMHEMPGKPGHHDRRMPSDGSPE
jgi:sulfite exporter TauE/SafE